MTAPNRIASHLGSRAMGISALLAVATLSMTASGAAGGPPTGFDAIDEHVRAAIEASSLPGLSYAVVRDGQIVHVSAFGTADSGGRPMTAQTPVVIGSVGKTMTALAIRQLIETGRIDEGAPVQRYLPWFDLATPDAARQITIRDLLEHRSGLSKADGQRPDIYRPGLTPEDVVRGLAAVRIGGSVGAYEYSNLNYVVLGVVVEAVSGQSYAEYLTEHVFAPLGMLHSYAAIEPARADGLAEGHRYLFGIPVAWDEPYPTAIVPAGYQISTADDMARYVAAFSNHGRYGATDIVGGTAGDRDYDIDWAPMSGTDSGYTPGHSGATLTSNAALLYVPAERLGVVVLTNANPTQLMNIPSGAFEIALDALRLSLGAGPGANSPSVRSAYLVVDTALLALVALLAVEILRLRGRRGAAARHTRLRLAGDLVIDVVLPLAILVGLPLWLGSTGTAPSLDIVGAWKVILWTLPDLGVALLAISAGLLVVGGAKIALGRRVRAAVPA